ncbi:MAG: hypothetical protein Fur0044_09700 [Anaerolineae bacterium]
MIENPLKFIVSVDPILRGVRHAHVPNTTARGRAGSSKLDPLSLIKAGRIWWVTFVTDTLQLLGYSNIVFPYNQ